MTWLNLTMSNQKVKNGLKAKKIKLPPNELPQKKFSCTCWPLSFCKILKNSYSGSWVMRMHHFWDQKSPFAPNEKKFFGKILLADPVLWGYAIFGPKMAHLPKWEFFSENVLMGLVSFIHANLHAKNQSQILIY